MKPFEKISVASGSLLAVLALACWLWIGSEKSGVRSQPATARSQVAQEQPIRLTESTQGGVDTPVKESIPGKFHLPSFGIVEAAARPEAFPYTDEGGQEQSLPMKVYHDENGRFLRAEFVKLGAPRYEHPPEIHDDDYRDMENKITGFPPNALTVTLPALLQSIHSAVESLGRFADLTSMDISYVVLETRDRLPQRRSIVFIVNTYGACAITDRIPPGRPDLKGVRFIFDPAGNLIVADNGVS